MHISTDNTPVILTLAALVLAVVAYASGDSEKTEK
jgi:hypothetical protein